MFTGITEELGTLKAIQKGSRSAKLVITAAKVLEGTKLGDSIAVNGVCLTVTEQSGTTFAADVMAETLSKSALGQLKPGDRVNLERALRLGDRLGGHLVSGHIDGVGIIKGQTTVDIAVVTEISAPSQVLKYVLPKGSIAIDGISLTVVDHTEDSFRVSLIPHTSGMTTLGIKGVGDMVNLEADVIGKYIERLAFAKTTEQDTTKHKGVSLDLLAEHGFI